MRGFGAAGKYWSHHAYGLPQTPFFSYLHPLVRAFLPPSLPLPSSFTHMAGKQLQERLASWLLHCVARHRCTHLLMVLDKGREGETGHGSVAQHMW